MFNRKKFQSYLEKNKISYSELARKFGVSEGTIRHIAVGIKQPSLAMACDIARLMGCSMDELVVEDSFEEGLSENLF